MKKLTVLFFATALLGTILGFQSCQSTKSAASTQMLKFNFEKGKSYDYEMNMSMDQEVMGQKMQMDMTSYYSMAVKEEQGDEKTVSATFERIKMQMNMGPVNLDIDSDRPVATSEKGDTSISAAMNKLNGLFSSLKGQEFTMKINSEGKVVSVSGMKEMADRIINNFGAEMSEAEKNEMRQQFDKQFSDEGMKGQFERFLYIFPNKEVKVGDSWTKTSSMGGDMPANYNSTYTVTEIEGDMVTLSEKSKVTSSDANMNVDGDVTGTIVVDSRSGLVVTSTQNLDMKITAGGQSIGMKGITKVKGKAN